MLLICVAIVAALVAGIAVALLADRSPEPTPPATDASVAEAAAIAARPDSHRLSDAADGRVTFVEFLDFECEACGAAFPYVEQLRAEYGDRVTFVMRYFPLPSHFNSTNAAVAAEAAARQSQLEAMYQKLFESQSEWGEKQDSQAPLFRTYAEELGLDMGQYDADIADPSTLERVKSDFDDGVALGVASTPTMYVNDVLVELTSFEDIRTAVENALAE